MPGANAALEPLLAGLIAHRLSTILAADQILALVDEGRLVDRGGTHAELMARGPTCLWEAQFGREGETVGIDAAS